MGKRYQILEMDQQTGKWKFMAHGAQWEEHLARGTVENIKARGGKARLIRCGKGEEQ